MLLDPVARDVEPGRNPGLVMGEHIVEEPGQRSRAPRPPDEAAVQADRQHLGRDVALGVERVERVLQVGVELVPRVEALRRSEAHVVGIERVGREELRPARPFDPVGKVVGIDVGAIKEAALLGAEPDRVDRRPSLVEAERTGARDLGMDADRLGDVLGLQVRRRVAIVDPFQAVGGDLPFGLVHRSDGFDVARHGGGDRVDGHRNGAFGEHPVQAPEPGARAIFVDQLHVHVAHARPGRRADDLRQEGLGSGVAMQYIVLAAFLVVDDELHRHARAVRPVGEWRMTPVADHVARIIVVACHMGSVPRAHCAVVAGRLRHGRRLRQPGVCSRKGAAACLRPTKSQ